MGKQAPRMGFRLVLGMQGRRSTTSNNRGSAVASPLPLPRRERRRRRRDGFPIEAGRP